MYTKGSCTPRAAVPAEELCHTDSVKVKEGGSAGDSR